jgi:hypothetical protein
MKDKQQTAVEWLIGEMSKKYIFNQDDFDIFKQAKEMELDQKIEDFEVGRDVQRMINNNNNE